MKLLFLGLSLSSIALLSYQAHAEDTRSVSIRTYGTIGFSQVISKKQEDGFGYDEVSGVSKNGSFKRDTRFGLNIQAPITNNVTAIFQMNAQGADQIFGTKEEFKIASSLLFLRFELVDKLKIMFGQTYFPLWLISEEQSIGFSYPWVRPPEEVYALAAPRALIGTRIQYDINVTDDVVVRPQFIAGDTLYANQTTSVIYTDAPLRVAAGILEIEHPNNTLRAIYGQGVATSRLSYKQEVMQSQAGKPELPVEVSIVGTSRPKVTFWSVGNKFNYENMFLMGEYAERKIEYRDTTGLRMFYENAVDKSKGYQVTLGYSFGKFTPIVVYAVELSEHSYGAAGKDLASSEAAKLADSYLTSSDGQALYEKTLDEKATEKAAQKAAELPSGTSDAVREATKAGAKAQYKASSEFQTAVRDGVKKNVASKYEDAFLAPHNTKQQSFIFGVNYNYTDNLMFKAQLQRTMVPNNDDIERGVTMLPKGAQANLFNFAVEFLY